MMEVGKVGPINSLMQFQKLRIKSIDTGKRLNPIVL